MDTVHNGLREGDLEKDTYDRLVCAHCEVELERDKGHRLGKKVYRCPKCETRWERT